MNWSTQVQKNRQGNAAVIIVAALCVLAFFAWLLLRGEMVKIPVGYRGKIKTASGYQEGVKQPGYFRMPSTWFGTVPVDLVMSEVFDHSIHEEIPKLYMPKDDLNLEFEIVGTLSIKDDEQSLDSIYSRLTATPAGDNATVSLISFKQVYNTYGKMVIRNVSQQVIASMSIDEVITDLDGVSKAIQQEVNKHLVDSPLEVRMLGLGVVQPPQIIITAQEKAKEREIENERAKAEKVISITNAEANYEVGLIRQQIDLVEAETQVLQDVVLNNSVSKAFIAQRALRSLKALADNPNVTFLLSSEVFENPASLLGFDPSAEDHVDENPDEKAELLAKANQLIDQGKAEAAAKAEAAQKASDEAAGADTTGNAPTVEANPEAGTTNE